MLPGGNESSRRSLSAVGLAFFKCWTVLTLVGLLLYVALSVLSLQKFAWFEVGAIACVTAALAVLLAAEEGSNDSRVDVANMTLAGCIYLLLAKRKIALGITMFAIAGSVAGAYYIINALVSVEYQGSAGTLVVKLPGQTVYYRPLHPFGWENTRIKLKDKQVFEVEITGRVSPGLIQEATKIKDYVEKQLAWRRAGAIPGQQPQLPDKVLWDFTGPEGYPESFYAQAKDIPPYGTDNLLTVRGRRHNEVIGVIVADGEQACHKKASKGQPCEANDVILEPGYDAKSDVDRLYFLSSETYPLKVEARKSGILWLTVNDADGLRFDNAGLFFVKVTISRW
jgi:hypothetical protein